MNCHAAAWQTGRGKSLEARINVSRISSRGLGFDHAAAERGVHLFGLPAKGVQSFGWGRMALP